MRPFINVSIWDKPMGIMDLDASTHRGRFEFLPSFLQLGLEISPVACSTEKLLRKTEVFIFDTTADLPAFFKDFLPGDHARTLLRHALHDSAQTPDKLPTPAWLSLLGDRSMGAFSFEPAGYPELSEPEPIDLNRLVKYAHQLYQQGATKMHERHLRELLRSGLFACGSSPKALVAINDFTGEVISGQRRIPEGFDAWILKLDGVLTANAGKTLLEYEYYKKALASGIGVSPCRLLKEGHHTHLLCKRFDRVGNEKIHVQSFAALRAEPENSYEAVFRCMRQLRLPYPDMEDMYRRMVFNVLSENRNDKPEKIIFTYTPAGNWKLGPAFNLKPMQEKMLHELSVEGKKEHIGQEDLLKLGSKLNIRRAKKILDTCMKVL
jgi:serine/threonine-protein kinase HipA